MLEILTRWNRWGNAKLNGGVVREVIPQLMPFLHTPEIVALIGPRRAGKTTVLFQIMDLLESGGIPKTAMLHLNLEEPALALELGVALLDKIYFTYREEIYPTGKAYVFLDEIQNVPGWERWVRARNESEEVKFFITGSSSRLMSKELATLLTGRHVSFHVTPLSFREFLYFKGIEIPSLRLKIKASPVLQNALNTYLRWGGFPEIVLAEDENRKTLLLKQYFDDILFKDVAMRHTLRDTFVLRNLAVYLLTQTGCLVSFQRLSKIFEVSLDLVSRYCSHLQEAFIIDFVPFYSRKAAERQRNPHKVYAVDLGLRRIVSLSESPDLGHTFETAVYHALTKKAQDGIFYWKRQGEIDFLIRRGLEIKEMIQVAATLDDRVVLERECRALEVGSTVFKEARSCIISQSSSHKEPPFPDLIPLWYYLLKDE